jgi:agmatine deiminase
MSTDSSTPRALGFRMPAEWEPHEATWIAWPHNEDDWPGRFAPIPWIYGEIVRKLSAVERVQILVHNEDLRESARQVLEKVGANMAAVHFRLQPTDRVWTRDFAPLFLNNAQGEIAGAKFRFNGWAKYENHLLDDAAGRAIPGIRWQPDLVLEGGSIDVNGAGLLLTTEECLLSPIQARNPNLSREQLESQFRDYLGVEKVLWLNRGIAGDDTHGHVDDLARFTSPDSIVIVAEDDPADPNHEPLLDNWQRVRSMPLPARKLPMPAPLWFDGVRLPASYANFYIANKTVLVPVFNDPNDRIALNTIAECFPGRQVIGINCVELVWGLGTLHCMTQQQPAGKLIA